MKMKFMKMKKKVKKEENEGEDYENEDYDDEIIKILMYSDECAKTMDQNKKKYNNKKIK